MLMHRRLPIPPIATRASLIAGVVALCGANPSWAEQPSLPITFKAEISLFWGGFRVYSGDIVGRVEADRYALSYRAATRGPLRMFVKAETHNQAEGRIADRQLRPVSYRGRLRWKKKKTLVDMTFGPGGTIETRMQPSLASRNRRPVPADLRKGALDPLTSLLTALSMPASETPCTWTQRIFDGRVLYELRFENKGTETLKHDGLTLFRGEAVRCLVFYKKIAGAAVIKSAVQKTEKKKKKKAVKKRPPTTIWLARVKGTGTWMVVRARGESKWGTIRAGLTKFSVDAPQAQ